MHIGLIIGNNRAGGMERQARLLAGELQRRGCAVTVFYACAPIPLLRPLRKDRAVDFSGIRVRRLYMYKFIRPLSVWFGRLLARHDGIDIFIGYNEANTFAGLDWRGGGSIPVVLNIRNIQFTFNSKSAQNVAQCVARGAQLLSNSEFGAQELTRLFGRAATVIHNGIVQGRETAHPRPGKFNMLYVANLHPRKDPMTFCRAAAAVLLRHPEARVTIVGDGTSRAELIAFFEEQSLMDHVKFTGRIPTENIPYGQADVLVNSSLQESSSNVICEALIHGVPVIGTQVGGTPELLRDRVYGRLFAPGDSAALTSLLEEFAVMPPAERHEIGSVARSETITRFSISAMGDAYYALAERLVREAETGFAASRA